MSRISSNLNRVYPNGYRLPRKNVLLVSCMDLRLLDEIVGFMEHDNLTNRYDQFILAGAALSACYKTFRDAYKPEMAAKFEGFENWRNALYNHIALAIDLHGIEDIYLMEHRECGAYKSFLKEASFKTDDAEKESHEKFARQFTNDVKNSDFHPVMKELNIHSFLMDLRGNVELLYTTTAENNLTGLNETANS